MSVLVDNDSDGEWGAWGESQQSTVENDNNTASRVSGWTSKRNNDSQITQNQNDANEWENESSKVSNTTKSNKDDDDEWNSGGYKSQSGFKNNRNGDDGGFRNRNSDRGGFRNRNEDRGGFRNRNDDRGGFKNRNEDRNGYRNNDSGGGYGNKQNDDWNDSNKSRDENRGSYNRRNDNDSRDNKDDGGFRNRNFNERNNDDWNKGRDENKNDGDFKNRNFNKRNDDDWNKDRNENKDDVGFRNRNFNQRNNDDWNKGRDEKKDDGGFKNRNFNKRNDDDWNKDRNENKDDGGFRNRNSNKRNDDWNSGSKNRDENNDNGGNDWNENRGRKDNGTHGFRNNRDNNNSDRNKSGDDGGWGDNDEWNTGGNNTNSKNKNDDNMNRGGDKNRNDDDWNSGGGKNRNDDDDWNSGGGYKNRENNRGGFRDRNEDNGGNRRGGGRGNFNGGNQRNNQRNNDSFDDNKCGFRNRNNDDDDWGDNQNNPNTRRERKQSDNLNNDFSKKASVNDEPEQPKRVTFVPDDDEEDYYLHVNSGLNFSNYDKIPVEVTGDDVPEPLKKFSELTLPDFLSKNIDTLKYVSLTPVQKYAIPIIKNKRDLMGCAQTGSGKTFAFLLPIITDIVDEVEEGSQLKTVFPKALIMAPTRELCRQIYTAARQLCQGSKIKCGYLYGGIEMNKSRKNLLDNGCDILVATPGRLIHFLELVWLSLKYLKFLVLDEADRMLDADGFNDSVNKIYTEANLFGEDRTIQISMFSATFPSEIQNLAKSLLKNYLFLAVGVVGSANSDVQQEIIEATSTEKVNKAIEYIKSMSDQKTLIFVDTKRMADFFGIKLGYLGYKSTTIHGDRDQQQREQALNDFKSGRVTFMVATNVAARGLDIPKVDTVVNVDMPSDVDTYVHRIGRTGRCGNVGRAVSFFDESKDMGLAGELVRKLEDANQPVPDWLKLLGSSAAGQTGTRRFGNQNRDNRSDVRVTKFVVKNDDDDDFMKGTNVDYDQDNFTSTIGASGKNDEDGWGSD